MNTQPKPRVAAVGFRMPAKDAGTSKYIDGSNNSKVLPYCRRRGLSHVPAARRAVRAGHRAYIVNADRTRGVTAACVEVDGVRIEFLRKYRKLAVTRLAGRG